MFLILCNIVYPQNWYSRGSLGNKTSRLYFFLALGSEPHTSEFARNNVLFKESNGATVEGQISTSSNIKTLHSADMFKMHGHQQVAGFSRLRGCYVQSFELIV